MTDANLWRSRGARTVVFPLDMLERLAPHAIRRGVSVNVLIRELVHQILDDALIDAVMDDGVDHG